MIVVSVMKTLFSRAFEETFFKKISESNAFIHLNSLEMKHQNYYFSFMKNFKALTKTGPKAL